MQADRSLWPEWAHLLQRRGLSEVTAALLEAAGPLNILFAQFLHAGSPFLNRLLPAGHWQALTQILENRSESQAFAAFLREEVTH